MQETTSHRDASMHGGLKGGLPPFRRGPIRCNDAVVRVSFYVDTHAGPVCAKYWDWLAGRGALPPDLERQLLTDAHARLRGEECAGGCAPTCGDLGIVGAPADREVDRHVATALARRAVGAHVLLVAEDQMLFRMPDASLERPARLADVLATVARVFEALGHRGTLQDVVTLELDLVPRDAADLYVAFEDGDDAAATAIWARARNREDILADRSGLFDVHEDRVGELGRGAEPPYNPRIDR